MEGGKGSHGFPRYGIREYSGLVSRIWHFPCAFVFFQPSTGGRLSIYRPFPNIEDLRSERRESRFCPAADAASCFCV